jgi:hypothetical protein
VKRPDPPLGHDGPGLDTRTDARSARVPKTIPIKNSTAPGSVRSHQAERTSHGQGQHIHRAPIDFGNQ